MREAIAFGAGFVVAALLTTYMHRLSRHADRLADPASLGPAEQFVHGLKSGLVHQVVKGETDRIETEIAYDADPRLKPHAVAGKVELRTHPHFVAALAYLANHPGIRGNGFGQIVITSIDEGEWPS